MIKKFSNLVYASIVDVILLSVAIISVQPDPKGVGLFLIILIAGSLATLAGTFALYFKFSKESFLYSWACVTGLVNFFLLFQIGRSILRFGIDSLPSFDIIFLFEALLTIYMLSRFFKRE